jgi:hypothetical protein
MAVAADSLIVWFLTRGSTSTTAWTRWRLKRLAFEHLPGLGWRPMLIAEQDG